jgi:hypothetical protein
MLLSSYSLMRLLLNFKGVIVVSMVRSLVENRALYSLLSSASAKLVLARKSVSSVCRLMILN